jgi:hypothetical protein
MLDAENSTLIGLFGEICVFLQLSKIRLFGGMRLYLHLPTP